MKILLNKCSIFFLISFSLNFAVYAQKNTDDFCGDMDDTYEYSCKPVLAPNQAEQDMGVVVADDNNKWLNCSLKTAAAPSEKEPTETLTCSWNSNLNQTTCSLQKNKNNSFQILVDGGVRFRANLKDNNPLKTAQNGLGFNVGFKQRTDYAGEGKGAGICFNKYQNDDQGSSVGVYLESNSIYINAMFADAKFQSVGAAIKPRIRIGRFFVAPEVGADYCVSTSDSPSLWYGKAGVSAGLLIFGDWRNKRTCYARRRDGK